VTTPVVFQYQQALDEFRREGREPPLLKRMSELISLLDLSTTLGSTLSGAEILDAALLIVMGELQVSRGALYVAEEEDRYRRRAQSAATPNQRACRLPPNSAFSSAVWGDGDVYVPVGWPGVEKKSTSTRATSWPPNST